MYSVCGPHHEMLAALSETLIFFYIPAPCQIFHLIIATPCKDGVVIPILEIRKLMPRERNRLTKVIILMRKELALVILHLKLLALISSLRVVWLTV